MATFFRLYREAFRGLPREIWFLSFVLFINRSGTMVLTFLPLYLTRELGFDMVFAGHLLSVYGLGHLAGALIGGWLTDRVGPLRIQGWALATSGLGFFVFEFLRSPGGLLAITFLVATAAESFRPANGAALAAFAPPQLRTRAVALNRMALNLGFGVGPAVGGWLATYDYAWLFRVDGATCMAASVLLVVLFRGRKPIVAASTDDGADEPATGHPFRDRSLLAFLALSMVFTLLFFQGWSTYPIYMNDVYGFDEARFGLLLALNAVLILLFEMVLTRAGEGFAPLRLAGLGALLYGLGLAILPLAPGVPLAVISVVVWTTGEMLFAPFAGGWIVNRASDRHRGKVMGLYTMAWGLGFVIAPTAGMWIYRHWGGTTLWLGVGVMAVLVALGFEILQRRVHREESGTLDTPEALHAVPAEGSAG